SCRVRPRSAPPSWRLLRPPVREPAFVSRRERNRVYLENRSNSLALRPTPPLFAGDRAPAEFYANWRGGCAWDVDIHGSSCQAQSEPKASVLFCSIFRSLGL